MSSPRELWEQRLADDFTLSGVGFQKLGQPFNTWMYRVRRGVFRRAVHGLGLGLKQADVLDVGSGTGFYLDCWRGLGVRSVTGCDLTQAAVDQLRRRLPGIPVHRVDIAEPLPAELPPGSFDAVSCMDVLFHITDDQAYGRAVRNLALLVRPGGWVLLTDNFLHGLALESPHQVSRPLTEIIGAIEAAGLRVVRRAPAFVLMNAPVDAGPRWQRVWSLAVRRATRRPVTGWLAGAVLYPVEWLLVRVIREGPSTELAVCRRSAEGSSG